MITVFLTFFFFLLLTATEVTAAAAVSTPNSTSMFLTSVFVLRATSCLVVWIRLCVKEFWFGRNESFTSVVYLNSCGCVSCAGVDQSGKIMYFCTRSMLVCILFGVVLPFGLVDLHEQEEYKKKLMLSSGAICLSSWRTFEGLCQLLIFQVDTLTQMFTIRGLVSFSFHFEWKKDCIAHFDQAAIQFLSFGAQSDLRPTTTMSNWNSF